DHWEILLRARAIETGCFVFAPAQTGNHEGGRKTYGHSLAIDPWGRVLADGGEEIGIVTAEIDPDAVVVARRKMPSLSHDREFFV
ncbi:MAG: carbon-nitrogen hydrolase family protein, partial [Rhodospirillaceae bacterium]|nr:carbon-nitrogen hydrolase family protein [Rhodospirillaceae bacterium]